MLKVCFDVTQLSASTGGIWRMALHTARALLERPEVQMSFISFSHRTVKELARPWRAVCVPQRLLMGLWSRGLPPTVEDLSRNADIYHTPFMLLPTARRAKTVLTVTDLGFLREESFFQQRRLNRFLHHQVLPSNIERADAIVAISHHTKEDLEETFPQAKGKTFVVHYGVDTNFFQPASISPPSPYLLYVVGTLEPRKNLERLFSAYKLCLAQEEMPPLVLKYGAGHPPRSLQVSLSRLGLEKHVIWQPPLDDQKLRRLYQGALFFVYPSLYEGFGLPLLEAMACGKACIASGRTSLPEVLGDAGLMINPDLEEEIAQAMLRLYREPELRDELGKRARARALAFDWKEQAKKTANLYRALVDG